MTLKSFCSLCVCALSLFATGAFADTVHVEGTASFEIRYTQAPHIIVLGQAPIQPKPYWVVVVNGTDGNQYELDSQFDMGDSGKPTEVNLFGKSIQNNFGVTLDGEIINQQGNYIWLDDVTNIETVDRDAQTVSISQPADPTMNWTCQGQMDSSTEVYVDVWFQAGSYSFHLSTAALQGDNRQFSELAYLDNGSARAEGTGTVFEAKAPQDSVSLEINNSDTLEQVPGVMSFSISESPRDLGVSTVTAANSLTMSCTRNR